ncbi:MAG: sensor histidine kinase, partial [Clostridia bacterium]|nr:sensor histidine kinase [Clostridia bacterium]
MDTKLKSFSHSIITKVIVFFLAVLCFTGAVKSFFEVGLLIDGHFDIVFEDNYYVSRSFAEEIEAVLVDLTDLIGKYKNEEHILKGGLITEERLVNETQNLWMNYEYYSSSLSDEENYRRYKEMYPDEIANIKNRLIKEDLKEYHALRQRLAEYDGLLYYAENGENVYSNIKETEKGRLKSCPVYLAVENYRLEFYPEEIEENYYLWLDHKIDQLDLGNNTVYIAFTEDFLNSRIKEWKTAKASTEKGLWQVAGLLLGFLLALSYLVVTAGRKSFGDKEVHFYPFDRLYNDVNLGLCIAIVTLWFVLTVHWFDRIGRAVVFLTLPAISMGLLLFLSLVKHYKNGTLLKHTLL